MNFKFTIISLGMSLSVLALNGQDIEKRIIKAKATVKFELDKTTADLLTENKKDDLVTVINQQAKSQFKDPPFSKWWTEINQKDLKDKAVIILTNVNPHNTDKIQLLKNLQTDIDVLNADIDAVINNLPAAVDSGVSLGSAGKANAFISRDLRSLTAKDKWTSYNDIQTKIIERIDIGLIVPTTVVDNFTTKGTAMLEKRDLLITQYKDLHQWIFGTSVHPNLIILHSENGKDWDDDPINVRKVLIIVIDGNNSLGNASFYAEQFKSAVTQEFGDLLKFIKDAGLVAMGAAGTVVLLPTQASLTLMEVDRSKIVPPGSIVALLPTGEGTKAKVDTVKVKIKEKIHIGFRIGVSSALIDRKIFAINNKQLVVKLDSANKEEWKQHLVATFNLNPWYRTGDYGPKMFSYNKDNNFLKRTSLFTGMNLSLTPFDNIYLGFAYDLSKDFTINGGITWNNTVQSGKINIGDISSLKDALSFSNKKYGPAKWFFALTFRPSVLSDILGLGDDKKDNSKKK